MELTALRTEAAAFEHQAVAQALRAVAKEVGPRAFESMGAGTKSAHADHAREAARAAQPELFAALEALEENEFEHHRARAREAEAAEAAEDAAEAARAADPQGGTAPLSSTSPMPSQIGGAGSVSKIAGMGTRI